MNWDLEFEKDVEIFFKISKRLNARFFNVVKNISFQFFLLKKYFFMDWFISARSYYQSVDFNKTELFNFFQLSFLKNQDCKILNWLYCVYRVRELQDKVACLRAQVTFYLSMYLSSFFYLSNLVVEFDGTKVLTFAFVKTNTVWKNATGQGSRILGLHIRDWVQICTVRYIVASWRLFGGSVFLQRLWLLSG